MSEGGEIGYSIKSETKTERKASHLTTNEGGGIWTEGGNAYYSKNHNEIANGLHSNKKNPAEAFFSLETQPDEMMDGSLTFLSKYKNFRKDYHSSELKKRLQETFAEGVPVEGIPIDSIDKYRFETRSISKGKEPFVATYIYKDILHIANHGNSQAVLGREGHAEPLTEYVPPEEKVKVTEHVLPQGESQLVLGSGLWNVITPEEAIKIIYHLYQENPDEKDPEKASKLLRDEAIKRLTERGEEIPDIIVMVVNLDIPERSEQQNVTDLRSRKSQTSYGRGFPKAA